MDRGGGVGCAASRVQDNKHYSSDVIFGAAVAAGLLSPVHFVYAALLISTSMAVTPVLAKLADRIGAGDQSIPAAARALR